MWVKNTKYIIYYYVGVNMLNVISILQLLFSTFLSVKVSLYKPKNIVNYNQKHFQMEI